MDYLVLGPTVSRERVDGMTGTPVLAPLGTWSRAGMGPDKDP
jgi:hypothetical protein